MAFAGGRCRPRLRSFQMISAAAGSARIVSCRSRAWITLKRSIILRDVPSVSCVRVVDLDEPNNLLAGACPIANRPRLIRAPALEYFGQNARSRRCAQSADDDTSSITRRFLVCRIPVFSRGGIVRARRRRPRQIDVLTLTRSARRLARAPRPRGNHRSPVPGGPRFWPREEAATV